MRAFYFYLIFVYIHKLPQRNWLESYKSATGKYRCGRSTFDREVFPMASALADIIQEIDYAWRLDPFNHALPPFDKYFTGIVDTLPVPLSCPADFHLASLYFQVSVSMRPHPSTGAVLTSTAVLCAALRAAKVWDDMPQVAAGHLFIRRHHHVVGTAFGNCGRQHHLGADVGRASLLWMGKM